jgi:hypothetical protein
MHMVHLVSRRMKQEGSILFEWAYSQLGYLKGWSNGKRTTKDYFGFLLHLLFHDYSGLVYDL